MSRKHNPWVALIALLLLAVILVMTCTGCSAGEKKNADRFVIGDVRYEIDAPWANLHGYVLTDTETGAQYLILNRSHGMAIITLQEGETTP